MTDNTKPEDFPPLPQPWSAASTIKCVNCGAPWQPSLTMAGGGAPLVCACGSTSFSGTLDWPEPPTKYTAADMRAYVLADRAARSEGREAMAAECKDAVREAISAAESVGHPLAGAGTRKRLNEARVEAFALIDRLASVPPADTQGKGSAATQSKDGGEG